MCPLRQHFGQIEAFPRTDEPFSRSRAKSAIAGQAPPKAAAVTLAIVAAAPIVRNQPDGRELTMARWGMPSPAFVLKARNSDPGVTNVRNAASPHWRRWLGVESRCVVPFTSFSENEVLPDGSRPPIWFALDETRPLACFAGIWTRRTSVRKVKEGETTNDLFAFLTPAPNALALQRPLPDDALVIVGRGEKKDEGGLAA